MGKVDRTVGQKGTDRCHSRLFFRKTGTSSEWVRNLGPARVRSRSYAYCLVANAHQETPPARARANVVLRPGSRSPPCTSACRGPGNWQGPADDRACMYG